MPADSQEELVQQLNDAGVITTHDELAAELILRFASGRTFAIGFDLVIEIKDPA